MAANADRSRGRRGVVAEAKAELLKGGVLPLSRSRSEIPEIAESGLELPKILNSEVGSG